MEFIMFQLDDFKGFYDCAVQDPKNRLNKDSSGWASMDNVSSNENTKENVVKIQQELKGEWDREVWMLDPSVNCMRQTSSAVHTSRSPTSQVVVTRPNFIQESLDLYYQKNKHCETQPPKANRVPFLKSPYLRSISLLDVQYYKPGRGVKALYDHINRACADSPASYFFIINCSKNKITQCCACHEINECMHNIFPEFYKEMVCHYTSIKYGVKSCFNPPSLTGGVPHATYKCEMYCPKYPSLHIHEVRQVMQYLCDNFPGQVYLRMKCLNTF